MDFFIFNNSLSILALTLGSFKNSSVSSDDSIICFNSSIFFCFNLSNIVFFSILGGSYSNCFCFSLLMSFILFLSLLISLSRKNLGANTLII